MENKTVYVKRIHSACCGMEDGKIYEAQGSGGDTYFRVKLPNGEWTSDHYARGFFEVVEKPHTHEVTR